MAEGPTFALFLRCVPGRLVPLFGTPSYIGARRAANTERADGAEPITFDEERVQPITVQDYAKYRKEYDRALRDGSVAKATEGRLARLACGSRSCERAGCAARENRTEERRRI
jgi:hypothetical protein